MLGTGLRRFLSRQALPIAVGIGVATVSFDWFPLGRDQPAGVLVVLPALVVGCLTALLAQGVRSRLHPVAVTAPPEIVIRLELTSAPTHLGANHHDDQLTPDDWIAVVRRELAELVTLADHVYVMTELNPLESEFTDDTYVRLDDLHWLLGNYVLNGNRVRRLAQLPALLRDFGDIERADTARPTRAAAGLRSSGTELLQRITQTNALVSDWLLSHRVALPDPDFLDSTALMDRLSRLEMEPTSVSGDPLYHLTCHIHDVLDNVEFLDNIDHPVLNVLEAQLGRVMTAIEHEVTAAQAFNVALISLVREARSADAA